MESAAARKERLKALKAKAEVSKAADDPAPIEPQLKFRNYQPTSKKIEHEVVAPAAPPAYQEPVAPPENTSANGQVPILSICMQQHIRLLFRDSHTQSSR